MREDWSLAIQGGGTRAVFACGVTDVLLEENIMPKEVYGTSAGVLIGLMYILKEKEAAYDIVAKGIGNPRFLQPLHYLFGGSLINFKTMLSEKRNPKLNKKSIESNPIDLYAVCTNLNTFESAYFDQRDPYFWDAVEGSCSLTMFRKKPVMVGDVPTLDGGFVERVPYFKPRKEGQDKIVIISSRERGYRFPEEVIHEKDEKKVAKRFKDYPAFVKGYETNRPLFNKQQEELEKEADEGRVFVIYPPEPIQVGLIEFNKNKIREAYLAGVKAAKEILPALRQYLSE